MLLNSASGLRWTSWSPTRHAVPYHSFSAPPPPQVQGQMKVMAPLMSLAHQGRVTILQRVGWSWWSSLSCSGCRSEKTCSSSVELWDDQSLATSGTEMESHFPTRQRGNWWWADCYFNDICDDCAADGSHNTHAHTEFPHKVYNPGSTFFFCLFFHLFLV